MRPSINVSWPTSEDQGLEQCDVHGIPSEDHASLALSCPAKSLLKVLLASAKAKKESCFGDSKTRQIRASCISKRLERIH